MLARGLAAVLVTLLLAVPAFAQDAPPPPPEAPAPAIVPPAPAPATPVVDAAKKFAKRGIIEIEGGIGFSYLKGGSYDFTLSPAGRYFVIDGLSVGLRFDVGYAKFSSGAGNDFTTTNVGLVPVVEYNLDLGSKLFPYAGAGFGYGYSKGSSSGFASSSFNEGMFDIGAGVKMVFGHGGILGLGIDFPIQFYDGGSGAGFQTSWAFRIVTRYAVFF